MGNACVGFVQKKQRKLYHPEIPSDIESFRAENLDYTLPKIMFEAEISNIQMINCAPVMMCLRKGIYSMNFQINDVISIMLPQKQVQNQKKKSPQPLINQIYWKLHEKFCFAMNQYQIRTNFLVVDIFGEKKNKINSIALNLYLVAKGPQHHDLEVMIGKNKFSRLKFDCKISEVVEVNLIIEQIKIEFDEDLEGEQFDYSFKIICNNEGVSYNQSSNPQMVKSPKDKNLYREPTIDDECKSPLKFRRSTNGGNKMIKKKLKSFVEWGSSEKKEASLMQIGAKILSNDINKCFFYFQVWKLSGVNAKQSCKDDWNLFAGAVINFNKMFEKTFSQKHLLVNSSSADGCENGSSKIGFDIEERHFTIQEALWGQNGDSSIGKCFIKLSMKNPKFQKQLQACALTEDGIVNMTFLFKSYVGRNTRLQNDKISKIASKYEEIEELLRKITSLPNDSYSNRSSILSLEEEVSEGFKQIFNSIKTTFTESLMILSPSNLQQMSQMIEDQLLLIQLMNKLYYYINDNTMYAGICWKIVFFIMKRGEFYLQNIGFVTFNKASKDLYPKKLNSAIKYQSILYQYFLVALRNQTTQEVRNHISSSMQAFKAYCYIKIPVFRQKLIDSIQKANDQDIVDFKLQQLDSFTADMSSLFKNKDNLIVNLNWEKYFHEEIRGNSQNSSLEREVQEEIQNSKWIKEVSRRQDAFFNFTAELVKELNQLTMQIKTWKWSYFPGYTKIVRGFMVQMKKSKILEYSQLMIKTSAELLANQQLINILMPIIIEKTNSYNKVEVLRCIEMLESFFECLCENKTKILPRTFNYLYFFRTFKLIMEKVQHNQVIIKSLILIYDFYESFSPEWRDNITMYLLGKVFFKLFFHWSFPIRIIFYNFLIIKVKYIRIQQISMLPSNVEGTLMNTKIADRYDEITVILANAQAEKKQQFKDFRVIYEKELFKKMKNNLKKKRENREKNSFSPNFSLEEYKLQKRYSVCSLSQTRARKLSFEDQILNNFTNQYCLEKGNQNGQEPSQKLQITRGSSFCLDSSTIQNTRKLSTDYKLQENQNFEASETSLQQILELKVSKTSHKERLGRLPLKSVGSKMIYNIYNKEDHELTQIAPTELNYLPKAIEEYRDTLNEVNKYYQKRGQLPKRQLQVESTITDHL